MSARSRSRRLLLTGLAAWLSHSAVAFAGPEDVVLLPTALSTRRTPDGPAVLHRADAEDSRTLIAWARHVDVTLSEAAQDLGLTIDVSTRASSTAADLLEDNLIAAATDSWVVSPRLELHDDQVRLRIVAVAPGSQVLLVRSEEIEPRQTEIRAMVMLRDVIQTGRGSPESPEADAAPQPDESSIIRSAPSPGRAVLALNAAVLGGFVGYTIQRASDSEDDRLTFPLIALGAAVGLGGSMIVADEWDVGTGDAWYLSASAFWPGVAGFLLADGYDASSDDRFVYGLIGSAGGITLATTALTFKGMSEGGALLTHSGGAFGLLLGGLAELGVEGDTELTPSRGMGFGAGLGVLAAGAAANYIHLAPSRVLLIDLGASLGALTGAAAGSPFLIVDEERSAGQNRGFVATVALGTVLGGGLGWYLTRPSSKAPEREPKRGAWTVLPHAGVVGQSVARDGRSAPAFGAGVRGVW